jgi:RNA polymerase sigma-70 factor, ECF subfamily
VDINIETIKRLNSGDASIYKALFDEYYKSLCLFANKYIDSLETAEDIVQEFFVSLWVKPDNLDFEVSVKNYLFQSVRNRCLNYLKHKNIENKYQQHILKTQSSKHFKDHLEEEEVNMEIHKIIESLPPQCKLIFKLSRFDEMKQVDIARQLNISISAVKQQTGKAIKILREKFNSRHFDFLNNKFSEN